MSVKNVVGSDSEDTRGELVRHARELFVHRGYAATTVGSIVRRAGMTKGALYHHFQDKEEIFRAVLEEMQSELTQGLREAAATRSDPLERLEVMARCYLRSSARPDFGPLVVVEAPAVLGWKEWCELTERHAASLFASVLAEAMQGGLVRREPPQEVARILLGTLDTAARVTATADSTESAGEDVWRTVARFLEGLRSRQGEEPAS